MSEFWLPPNDTRLNTPVLPDCGVPPQQGPGCAGLAKVAPPGPCGSQTTALLRILRLPEVIARVGLKRASIYLHIGKGTFPKQISLGPRAVGWLESEIDAWVSARIMAARGQGNRALIPVNHSGSV